MILVTGGTGFIGQVLIRHLVSMGLQVRTLLRPSPDLPNLPRGVAVEAVICGLQDERGLRAAMKGVDVIFHLAGAERKGTQADLMGVDIEGTKTVANYCRGSQRQAIFLPEPPGSRPGFRLPCSEIKSDRGKLHYPKRCSLTPFSAPRVIYGPDDQFTTELARLLRISPGFF